MSLTGGEGPFEMGDSIESDADDRSASFASIPQEH
jgi:hypothetical protein